MMRMIQVQGPYEAIDAVMAVGREDLLYFQDYFRDRESTYSALLVIFDDTVEAEEDVLEQARTLLAEKGVDPSTFRVADRFLHYPDALEADWYRRLEGDFVVPLLALEALGVRSLIQQAEMDRLREEVTRRVAGAGELAEANIETFVGKISALLNKVPDSLDNRTKPDPGYVGKYEGLWVLENEHGLRWSVHLKDWVTEESNEFSSWSDTELERDGLDADDLDEVEAKYSLPSGGEWININEA